MIREYIKQIAENGNNEDMQRLGDMLAEIICKTKEAHHDLYKKYKKELYEMAYGKVLTKDMAEEIVHNMKPEGEYWTIEQTKDVQERFGLKDLRDIDFYIVMNMAHNDFRDVFEDNIDLYVKYSKSFILDEDAKDGKVYIYFTEIVN